MLSLAVIFVIGSVAQTGAADSGEAILEPVAAGGTLLEIFDEPMDGSYP